MNRRRILFVPFGAVALVTALAATAFACTLFRGTLTLQGNASRGKVTSTGTGTGMTQTVSDGIAKATVNNGSIKLWAGADPYGRTLPQNTYYVRYYNSNSDPAEGPGYTDHTHWWTDCMYGGPGITLGTARVNNRGKFVGQPLTFALPNGLNADTAPQESAVCVSDNGGAFGNQAPLTMV